MPEHVMSYVAERGIHQKKIDKLEDAIVDTDILYMTRIQKERFSSEEEYNKVFFFKNIYIIYIKCVFNFLKNVS